jgi:hypothetical protein
LKTLKFLYPTACACTCVKARVQFSSSDACERVLYLRYECSEYNYVRIFLTHPLVHMYQKKKIASKTASVNGSIYKCTVLFSCIITLGNEVA